MPPFSLQTIDHVVIRAVNAAELVAFYVDAIGCKLAWDRPELGLTHLEAGDEYFARTTVCRIIEQMGEQVADRVG